MENKKANISEAILLLEVFDRMLKGFIDSARAMQSERIAGVVKYIPPEDMNSYFIFLSVCLKKGVSRIDQLEGLTLDEKINLAADFYDKKKAFEAKEKKTANRL